MEDMADLIVKRARTMPVDTGIALECNGAVLAKVKVTGGVGVEVRAEGSTLLFPMAQLDMAIVSFLTSAHTAPGLEFRDKHHPTVRHANGLALLHFEWNCVDFRRSLDGRTHVKMMGTGLAGNEQSLGPATFENLVRQSKKERVVAHDPVHTTIARYILNPPLCTSTALEPSSQPFDARGMEGWEAA